jgi:hypothetical protein
MNKFFLLGRLNEGLRDLIRYDYKTSSNAKAIDRAFRGMRLIVMGVDVQDAAELVKLLCEEQPISVSGTLPISRACHRASHDKCLGIWTQYPNREGKCRCGCHIDRKPPEISNS